MPTPRFTSAQAGSIFGALAVISCAGPAPQTPTAPVAPPPVATAASAHDESTALGETRRSEAAKTPADTDDAYDDPEEAQDPATLKPVLGKGTVARRAKSTVSERECWQSVSLSGEARKDYAALIEHCGLPTGSFEYAKPATGKLDHVRDKRDTFIVFLRGGLCYRFFGVGDSTIHNLDILIERNGALQGEDRTHGPVAIINTDEAWCMDSDAEYRFLVQIGGEGRGRYVFGVWARPGT